MLVKCSLFHPLAKDWFRFDRFIAPIFVSWAGFDLTVPRRARWNVLIRQWTDRSKWDWPLADINKHNKFANDGLLNYI